MSKRKHSPRTRSFRPEADGLETRQMLSGVVSGTDIDGDIWTLRLIGPGSLGVVKQNDSSGTPNPLNSSTEINTITIAGTNPTSSKLVGSVVKGTNGDGKVFFQNLVELPAHSAQFAGLGLGLVAINMPNFYLGNTTPETGRVTTNPSAPTITIPDGVDTLNFGGVDMTHDTFVPATGTTSINGSVQLGTPLYGGTRVIINKSVSTHVSIPPASSTGTATTVQEGAVFAVAGRLDLFQANEIDGDGALPPAQFTNLNSAAIGTGGTMLVDTQPGAGGGGYAATGNFFTGGGIKGPIGGQIGDVRIGGNATNFTTLVADPATQTIDRISNFSVGGETNNVIIVAPNGLRNAVFGKGLDNSAIYTHVINTLKANRDFSNSTVYVDRTISSITVGGNVGSSTVRSGVVQSYSSIFSSILGATGIPGAPPTPSSTQPFGGMQVLVAGNVTNSVFAASVQPATAGVTAPDTGFGDSTQLVLPGGKIGGKIEGKIDNSIATPKQPTKAFYAETVTNYTGPVVPPTVPEAPYNGPAQPTTAPGIANLNKVPTITIKTPKATTATNPAAITHAGGTSKVVAKATPKGPAATKAK